MDERQAIEQQTAGGATASTLGQLALWSAANLAGVATAMLVIREPFFRRLINKLLGKPRRRVIRVRRPSFDHSLPLLAEAVVGTTRGSIFSVLGPPPSAALPETLAAGAVPSVWNAATWYYPLPSTRPMAMAINFDENHANIVEFFEMPLMNPRSHRGKSCPNR